LHDAVLRGSAPDGGLYMPVEIPPLKKGFLERLPSLSFPEIAQEVGALFAGDEIPQHLLMNIVMEAFNFPVPLIALGEGLHILELFHGPTLAFKDFGARFMARLMGYFVAESGKQLTVIVATSGDTGSAVAQAFLGVSGIRVVILYPAGRVSDAQEKQLTTLGQNITALEVSGSFDDCQRLAKEALVDPAIAKKIAVTSANLGNLTGGLLAKRIGLGVAQFIAATNANDVVPEFLRSGKLIPRASRHTISNAMDVGNPSNFARIVDLYENDLQAIRRDIWGCSFNDEETLRIMHDVNERHGYVLDPHTAVGVLGWQSFVKQNHSASSGIVLATAHPAKFGETVARATGVRPEMPERLAAFLDRPKKSIVFPNRFSELQEFLISANT
jgi:threonine synthase